MCLCSPAHLRPHVAFTGMYYSGSVNTFSAWRSSFSLPDRWDAEIWYRGHTCHRKTKAFGANLRICTFSMHSVLVIDDRIAIVATHILNNGRWPNQFNNIFQDVSIQLRLRISRLFVVAVFVSVHRLSSWAFRCCALLNLPVVYLCATETSGPNDASTEPLTSVTLCQRSEPAVAERWTHILLSGSLA